MRRNQTRVHVAGMARGVAQPRDPGHIGDTLQQSPERPWRTVGSFAVIGINVLADQRDFAHSRVGQPLDLGDNLHHRPRYLGATRVRHDAAEFGIHLSAAFSRMWQVLRMMRSASPRWMVSAKPSGASMSAIRWES